MLIIASWVLTASFAVLFVRNHWRLVLVARASHELRGPLSAVQLGLETLTGEPARVAAISFELARAGRALDDLAAAPSGARGRDAVELVDLATFLEAHAVVWTSLAAKYSAELRIEAPASVVVRADPVRLAQACANLIGNAAEHGGGVVHVAVRAGEARARIEVTDDGPGLPASVAALARPHRGRRGHGLAIASAIAEQHGGRLAAAPSARGARLVLELPTATSARPRGTRRWRAPRWVASR